MEDSKSNLDKSKSQEINSFVYATNVSVVIILCLCVAAYFIVEKNISINSIACTNIFDNSKLLSWAFYIFLLKMSYDTYLELTKTLQLSCKLGSSMANCLVTFKLIFTLATSTKDSLTECFLLSINQLRNSAKCQIDCAPP